MIALMFVITITKAQTAMQLSGPDCNGISHDLFADLDAGKVVLLHFFMANCGACPPPAQKIQAMANNILATHPGMITGYALPYVNSTTCAYTSSWVSSSGLSLYAPYDSGAVQVAHYGGFGMPTVVLLAGSDHRIMFLTMSFATSDTTIMRDSILNFINRTTGITDLPFSVTSFNVFPNPANDHISIHLDLKENTYLFIDVLDITGKEVTVLVNEKQSGVLTRQFDTSALPNGNYQVRLQANGKTAVQKLTINH